MDNNYNQYRPSQPPLSNAIFDPSTSLSARHPPSGPQKAPPPFPGPQGQPRSPFYTSPRSQFQISENLGNPQALPLSNQVIGTGSTYSAVNGHSPHTPTGTSESCSNLSSRQESPVQYLSRPTSQPNSGNASRQSPSHFSNISGEVKVQGNIRLDPSYGRSGVDANTDPNCNKLNGDNESDSIVNIVKHNMNSFSKSDSNILDSVDKSLLNTANSSTLNSNKTSDNILKQNEKLSGSESSLVKETPQSTPSVPISERFSSQQLYSENLKLKEKMPTSSLGSLTSKPNTMETSSLMSTQNAPSLSLFSSTESNFPNLSPSFKEVEGTLLPNPTTEFQSNAPYASMQGHQPSIVNSFSLSASPLPTSIGDNSIAAGSQTSSSVNKSISPVGFPPQNLVSNPPPVRLSSYMSTQASPLRPLPPLFNTSSTSHIPSNSMGYTQTYRGPPPTYVKSPTSVGLPQTLMGSQPINSLGSSSQRLMSHAPPQTSMGSPLQSSERPLISSSGELSSSLMRLPPSSVGPPPPSSMGPPPPSSMGPPLPSSMRPPPPSSMRPPPPSSMRPPPPSSMRPPPPSSMRPPPPSSMRPPPPSSMGPPPPSSMGPPPPSLMGPPPPSSMGPPSFSSIGPPPSSMGPPLSSSLGRPPFNSIVPPLSSMELSPSSSMKPQSLVRPPPPTSMGPPPTNSVPPSSLRMNSARPALSSSGSHGGSSSSYVTQQQPLSQNDVNQVSQQLGGLSVAKDGWNKGWGTNTLDLLQQRNIVPPHGVVPPKPVLVQDYLSNCSPDIFRCTVTKIPETQSILQKSRLPFGILIHPFKDLEQPYSHQHLPVVSCNTIVRCRSCRTYINPFVVFKGDRRWECNLCYRVNEIPDEFLFDPLTRTYGDPARRPEVREATIEFIAPQEYMLRPPQPAAYLFVLDVSRQAVETGYLKVFCETLLSLIDKIPGDRRTLIGFITYASSVQFYLMAEGSKSVQMLEVGEVEDIFLPSPEDLLVNLEENRNLIEDFLISLPDTHSNTCQTQTALGAALTAAYKLISPIGGRITVMAISLPRVGPGCLKSREDPNQRSAKDISNLGPATDFYKKLALDCSGQQVSVDLFALNSHYIDLATLSGMSKFSGGSIYHFPGFNAYQNPASLEPFKSCLIRYLTRKIGFEAVMRIRATRGLAITNFHGNFFVRSTDLLSLPNINPDSGFGMQVNLEEPLHNIRQACFQAALLYTSSKGERRIRVHTLCLPVSPNVHEIINSGDQQAIVALLAKMAVDKCLTAQMSDAREALINACVDSLTAYKLSLTSGAGLQAPPSLQLLPLYALALLKSVALRHGMSTKLDDRVFAMCELKTLPLSALIQTIYPDLYSIHNLSEKGAINIEDLVVPQPGRLHLSAEYIDRNGAYLMDAGSVIYIYIRSGISSQWVDDVIGVPSFAAIPQPLFEDPLPCLDNVTSELVRNFVLYLQKNKPYPAPIHVIREDNPSRVLFINCLADDRSEGAHSYVEFLQFVKSQIK